MSKEQLIKEARTIEAMKKGYMGLAGKFCVIAKFLGEGIYHQGGGSFTETYLDDPFYSMDDDIPTMDENEVSSEVGVMFDGLSRGINLNIFISNHLGEIICRFKGEIVYHEIAGELEGYAPNEEWENHIENLTLLARKIEKRNKPIEKEKILEESKKKKIEILDYFKKKWGL